MKHNGPCLKNVTLTLAKRRYKMITINESKRTEVTIEYIHNDIFIIKEWSKKTGNCTDTIYLNKSDINAIKMYGDKK